MSHTRVTFALALALLAPGTVFAQLPRSASSVNRAPDKNASQILITMFSGSELRPVPAPGSIAAEEMRKQVADAFPFKEVYVTPTERYLSAMRMGEGQFSVEEPPGPHDAKALARMFRADEYVLGTIKRMDNNKFRLTADLVLSRDMSAVQPLGIAESKSIPDAVKTLVREMKHARKQIVGERQCTNAAGDGNFSEAISFARAAIALYPKATIARMCLASALNASKAPQDSVLKVVREILALDPRNNFALRFLPADERRKYPPDSLPPDTTHAKHLRQ